jgi:anthranilate phosphoribosyltransferase
MSELAIRQAIARLVERRDLPAQLAEQALGEVMEGKATPAQIAAFAIGLRMKGETSDEVMGSVRALRARMVPVLPGATDLVDTAGTGGDGAETINISTAAALVAAAAGARIAKHGNRAVSSRCGSADVIEALGIPLEIPASALARAVDEIGFAFLFAPRFHPALGRAASVRRELGVRTLFNLIGPMANPAGARRQLIGVYDASRVGLVADTLAQLGTVRALVVHGEGPGGTGLDEVSIFGPTSVAFVENGEVRHARLGPEDFGVRAVAASQHEAARESLRGGTAEENAARIRQLVGQGGVAGAGLASDGPARDAVVANAAAALWAGGQVDRLAEGADRAKGVIEAGSVTHLLERLVAYCRLAALTRSPDEEG